MKLLLFLVVMVAIIGLAADNAIALHGAINITLDKIVLIGAVIVIGAVAIINPRFFVVVLVILLALAVFVTVLRGGRMPWQP